MAKTDNRAEADTWTDEKLGPLYWVVMHNDPVTTMEFVVRVLVEVFGVTSARAVELMYNIHNLGLEHVVLMPLERAEFKVETVHRAARAQGYPLTCTVEPEQ